MLFPALAPRRENSHKPVSELAEWHPIKLKT